jgi:hypothetical protein
MSYYSSGMPHKDSTNQRQYLESPNLTVATTVTQFDHSVKCTPKAGVSHTVSQPPPDRGHLDAVSTMGFSPCRRRFVTSSSDIHGPGPLYRGVVPPA